MLTLSSFGEGENYFSFSVVNNLVGKLVFVDYFSEA